MTNDTGSPPTLHSNRLTFRALNEKDIYSIQKILQDQDVVNYDLGNPVTSYEEADYYLKRMKKTNFYSWGIVLKETNQLIGLSGFRNLDLISYQGEIGAVIAKAYWKQGFGREILQTILSFGFKKLSLNRIYAKVLPQNKSVNHILRKYDFLLEGTLRETIYRNGSFSDINIYSLLKKEYKHDHS
ncbi:GNAT family N-acetyltransferase [Rossellomorea sp. BNER]|uniref:GNAT family N-acetyltransferase n=1 Tax=Rossellomorea sp. BNER TaxID=2962031 RepID=UPI003AF294A6|nr:GNAT family N-acetyltransferase [Rossellomorea sp. BNER]